MLEDAAGNRTIALDRTASFALPIDELQCPRSGCVTPAGALNGAGASAACPDRAAPAAPCAGVPYGRRVAISGRAARGVAAPPIGGALVDVAGQTRRLGAPPHAARQVRTGADGRFRVVIPKGPSRTVRLAYRARLGDADAGEHRGGADPRARGGAAGAAAGRACPAGRSVRVRGRVLGGPFPHGTLAELQALDGREWRTFKTLARRAARALRLPLPLPPHQRAGALPVARATCARRPALPYAASSSRPRWVLVR